jgi:hypothetical protein
VRGAWACQWAAARAGPPAVRVAHATGSAAAVEGRGPQDPQPEAESLVSLSLSGPPQSRLDMYRWMSRSGWVECRPKQVASRALSIELGCSPKETKRILRRPRVYYSPGPGRATRTQPRSAVARCGTAQLYPGMIMIRHSGWQLQVQVRAASESGCQWTLRAIATG